MINPSKTGDYAKKYMNVTKVIALESLFTLLEN